MNFNDPTYQLQVPLGDHAYPIYIGCDFDPDRYGPIFDGYPRIALMTNDTLNRLYAGFIGALQRRFRQLFVIQIKDGEPHKNLATLAEVYTDLIDRRCGRDTLIAALGGGVVGDLAGFAAATYMRGIDVVQLPTTLLAMVDSSVGGKTAVNLPQGKNLVGAFHQPKAVFCDLAFLKTLPPREFSAGLAEVIKYGLILDAEVFEHLLDNKARIIRGELEPIAYLVYHSCRLKSEIVVQDETDQGLRSVLNFGHTIGHALESCTAYATYLHGEAVALGLLVIVLYLIDEGRLPSEVGDNLLELMNFFNLPSRIPADLDVNLIMDRLQYDKKWRAGRPQWVTIKRIGTPLWGQDLDLKRIEVVLKRIRSRA